MAFGPFADASRSSIATETGSGNRQGPLITETMKFATRLRAAPDPKRILAQRRRKTWNSTGSQDGSGRQSQGRSYTTHKKLDAAVFAACGWDPTLTDDQILARLLALDLERATSEPDNRKR